MAKEDSKTTVSDEANIKESVWNVNFYAMDIIFPGQPAQRQMIGAVTGLGLTYKFSERAHLFGKWSDFTATGISGTQWHHQHILGGAGIRFYFAERNQLVVNVGMGKSEVEETSEYGSISDLQMTALLDIKYHWISDNLTYGPVLTIVETEPDTEDLENYIKGGYVTIGFTVEFGIPDLL